MQESPSPKIPSQDGLRFDLESLRKKLLAGRETGWNLSKGSRRVLSILLTLAAIAILGRMIYSNWDSLRSYEWKIYPAPLAGTFLVYALSFAFGAFLWGEIIHTLGSPAPRLQHIRIYLISALANRIPLPLSNVASRLLLYDESTSKTALSFASGLELVLIILSGFGTGLLFWPDSGILLGWKGGLLALAVGLVGLHPRVLNRLLTWLKVQGAGQVRYYHTIIWFLLYCLVWIFGGCVLYLVTASFYPIQVIHLPQVIGAWILSGLAAILVVFLPVGLGIREATMGLLLSTFMPAGIAAAVAILSRLLLTVYEIIFAGIASLIKVS